MGIFRRKEKESEFVSDIKKLLSRNDLKTRAEIAEVEFKKALGLFENAQNQEDVIRAYNIMGPLAAEFEYIPAILWMGDFAEELKQNPSEAAFWFKKAADKGDVNGAKNYADLIMAGKYDAGQATAIKYYEFAAKNGHAEAAFVMGEILRMNGNYNEALKYYEASFNNGYSLAKIRIEQLKNI